MTSGFDLGHDLDLEFSRSNIEFAISQPKMVRLPRNEKQTYQLNSGAQMWPAGLTLAMTLTLNFKVKYRICYISAKNGPIATKRKANISIELWGSNVTSGFDLGHDLDLEFSRSNIEFAISQPKMVRLPRNEKQTYWLNSRPQMWPMVWIYQIVTGVTSVVGVPSTHLVTSIIKCCMTLFTHFQTSTAPPLKFENG